MLFVDKREPTEIVSLLREYGTPITREELVIGDYVTGEWVIERKETKDFLSSIFDNRLWDQAYNMLINYRHPVFIIEGGFPVVYDKYTLRKQRVFVGALVKLMHSYNCNCIMTPDKEGTAYFIRTLYSSLTEKKETLKPVVKKGKTYSEIKENILAQIPHIGRKTAKELLKQFHTIENVISNLKEKTLFTDKKLREKQIEMLRKYLCE